MSGMEGVSQGKEMANKFERETADPIALDGFQAQVALARFAFPHAEKPMNEWLKDDELHDSLSSRFRAYLEEQRSAGKMPTIDIHNEEAMTELLGAVRKHAPETLH
jgi:hypothetical protein